jgi:hypothetical protein
LTLWVVQVPRKTELFHIEALLEGEGRQIFADYQSNTLTEFHLVDHEVIGRIANVKGNVTCAGGQIRAFTAILVRTKTDTDWRIFRFNFEKEQNQN